MFRDCASLTSAPELPATMLAEGCYASMFSGCTSLSSAPELPATTLAESCYLNMFSGCKNLKVNETSGTKFLDIPAGTETPLSWNSDMFAGTGGTFTGDPEVGKAYYYDNAPDGPVWGKGTYTMVVGEKTIVMSYDSDLDEYLSTFGKIKFNGECIYMDYPNVYFGQIDKTKASQEVELYSTSIPESKITATLIWTK